MNNDHCLYCGSSDIIPVDEEHYLEQNLHIMQCRQCRVMFTELEQRMEADSTPLDYKPDFDVSDEDATLDAVWKQWCINRNYILELLFQHKHPLKHPVEFMIFRTLLQMFDASYTYSLLTPDKNYDHLYASEHLLAMLINNLRQIEYFLSSYTEDQRLRAMQRLYEAFSGLRRVEIYVGQLPGRHRGYISSQQRDFATSIYQQRLDAIIALAEQLEDMYEAGHGPEYLKMAGRLWHKCLGTGKLYDECATNRNAAFSSEWIICLPEKRRQDIAEKVSAISKKIHKIEPDFRLAEPGSWKKLLPWGCGGIYILLIAVCLLALVFILLPYGAKLPDDDPKKFLAVVSPFVFPCLAMVPLFGVLIWKLAHKIQPSIQTYNNLQDDKLKREQIYNRLYKTADKETL